MRRLSLAALSSLVFTGSWASGVSALTLAEDGASDYRIVVDADAGPAVRRAGRELADYLARATGAELPITTHAGDGPIIVLATGATDAVSPEAFRIETRGRNLRITGNSGRAVLYGVYRFLEDYVGVHWFEPERADVPRHHRLQVDVESRAYAPRFAYREVFFRGADDPEFAARNRLNGRFGHRLQARIPAELGGDRPVRQVGIFDLVPRDEHPGHFFGGGQLRFAEPAVQRAAQRRLRDIMAGWQEPPAYLFVEHADRETYYSGGRDGELIQAHGAPSAAFVDFVRELAGVVQQQHPQVTVLAQAYLWSRQPPRNMPLPDNMGVLLAGIERDFSKPLTVPENRAFLADVDGWARLTRHIVVWDYVIDFAGYIQPYPNVHTLADNLRALAQRDAVEGVFAQGAYGTRGAELAPLRTWLLARLLWEPDRDAKVLIATFLRDYFGPAAPQLAAYLQLLEQAGRRWPGKLRAKTPANASYLDTAFLRRADRLFAQAEAAVADRPRYRQRVQTARIPVDYAVLANRRRLDGDWVEAERRHQRLARYLDQAGVTAYREGGGADTKSLLAALAIDRRRGGEPALCAERDADTCLLAEDDALHLVGGGAALVADPAAADGAAAALPGNANAWGIQLPLAALLPESGRWRIYVRARVEPADAVGGAVMQVGVQPGGNRSFSGEDAAGAEYRTLAVPGIHNGGGDGYLWLAPGNVDIRRILVDRVMAIAVEN